MAIFANGAATQSNSVGTSSVKIFDVAHSGIPTGVTLKDVTIVNTGLVAMFLGSFTAVTAVTGLRLDPGDQITFNGYSHAQGDTTGNIFAITASGTTSALTGLATVNANV